MTYAFGEYQRMTLMKKNVIVSEKVRSYSSIFIRIYGYDEYILYRKSLKHIRLFNFSHMFFIHLTTVMNLKYCQVWFYKKEKSHKYCWIVHLLYYKIPTVYIIILCFTTETGNSTAIAPPKTTQMYNFDIYPIALLLVNKFYLFQKSFSIIYLIYPYVLRLYHQ